MVRYSTKGMRNSSENFIVGVVLALAVILFIVIVMWPSTATPRAPLQSVSATPLATQLNDAETIEYLTVLQRVEPAAAVELHKQADAAIASGADNDELAMLVLGAMGDDLEGAHEIFFKADVKYFDKILNVTKIGLARLSNNSPKFCRASHYEALAESDPADMLGEFLDMLGYDSAGYTFALALNQVLVEGIEDGRKSPNNYGRLNTEDEQALQALLMRMMTSPKMANVMRIQSLPPVEQKRAMGMLNVCDLSSEVIAGVLALPQDTRKRVMGEMNRMAKSGGFEDSLQDMASGF